MALPLLRRCGAALVGRPLLLALGTCVGLFLAEGILALLGPPSNAGHPFLRCDPLLGWRGIPHHSYEVKLEWSHHVVVRNSRGMHGGEHALEKTPGVFRTMFLGDSFVAALQVPEQETHHQLVEDRLNARAGRTAFEMINAGVGGWSPAQEYLYFRHEGQQYAPDAVVLFWYPANDLWDLTAARYNTCGGVNCYSPYFNTCAGELDPEPWYGAPGSPSTWAPCDQGKRKWLNGLLHELHVRSRIYRRLGAFRPESVPPLSGIPFETPWTGRPTAVYERAWDLTRAVYRRLIQEARNQGARVGAVAVPFRGAVHGELQRAAWQAPPSATPLPWDSARRPNETFRDMMAEHGVPVLDLHGPFVEHLRAGGDSPFYPDSHWNGVGNEIAATELEPWLMEQGLIPPPPPRAPRQP